MVYTARAYRDVQTKPEKMRCDECDGELYEYDKVYHYEDRCLCKSCFVEAMVEWVKEFPGEPAELLGVEVETL